MERTFDKQFAYTLEWDHAPIDLSFVFASEAPAGKHGFLTVRDGRFTFADGTDARFWGTNFNSAQCFPSHAHSMAVARRLAQFGVNIVRFHQMDSDWSTPNIFQYTKGPLLTSTRALDPRSMDSLDYLIWCLKAEGIYVYLDMMTYRRFRTGDGVEAAEKLGDAAKPYACFDRTLIELQKEFNEQLWTHHNPYTGLAYKDDPAIVLTEVVNESDINHFTPSLEPFRATLERRYREWAAAQGIQPVADPDFRSNDPDMVRFVCAVHQAYYREIIEHLRSVGVRIPVTGTNWTHHVGLVAAQEVTDFTDSHVYWYDWTWKPSDKKFNNRTMLSERDGFFKHLGIFRLTGKPFFVSEWDMPWPNEWRAESVLRLSAVAAFQGWQGAAIHTYRYTTRENVDMIGQPITSDAIGGVAYRGGVFDTFNDPAKFGLFYHAALILRRGDVSAGQQLLEMDASDWFPGGEVLTSESARALDGALEQERISLRLTRATAPGARQVAPAQAVVPDGTVEIRSSGDELRRNLAGRYGIIDSPRTKVLYGFAGAVGEVRMNGVRIALKTPFGVVAISSLSDAPIESSDNLLITAVGRADNTGCRYNADHTVQFDPGHGPIQVEVIDAQVAIRTANRAMRVQAINPDGFPIGPLATEYADGELRFALGSGYPSMYYLVQTV